MNELKCSSGILRDNQIIKILLVEDNVVEAELLKELFLQIKTTQFVLTHAQRLSHGLKYLIEFTFDIILLDLSLPDSQGLNTVVQVKAQAPTTPIVVLTSLNDQKMAIEVVRKGAQDYLVKGQFAGEGLVRAIRYAIERERDREAIRQQAKRERILERMVEQIRRSLDLEEILHTTVTQVRQFLKTDRVLIYRYQAEKSKTLLLEAADYSDGYPDIAAINELLNLPKKMSINENLIQLNNNRGESNLEPKSLTFHDQSVLAIPIRNSESDMKNPQSIYHRLWGVIIAHHCTQSRQWATWEIDCLNQLVKQVAIAIQQSELYQKVKTDNQHLQQLVKIDSLTQIANRRRFDQVLADELLNSRRNLNPLSLILCDIDFFKAYNDTYGHLVGDDCLKQVAQAICQGAQRPTDLVARYGGEEFAVILANTDTAGAFVVAQKIRYQMDKLKRPHAKSPIHPWVTLSLGIATTTSSGQLSPTELVEKADRALYKAKALGRDRIFSANSDLDW
ncbi:diguanylate cyclase domain-containing protein [Coleofasciculus sp.]|uniref:diguanylate cyclase domain-containing protein n=1 Tax=Coleofasciculus sp. TaxID=3100458 RepID=UPI0039F965B4